MGGSRIGLILGWVFVFVISGAVYLQNHDAITAQIWWEGEGRAWFDELVSNQSSAEIHETNPSQHSFVSEETFDSSSVFENGQEETQSEEVMSVTSEAGGIFRFYDDKVVMDLGACDDRTGPFFFTLTFENGSRIRVNGVDPLLIVRLVHRDPEILNNISEIRGVAAQTVDDVGRAFKDPYEGVLYVFVWPSAPVDQGPESLSLSDANSHKIVVYPPESDEVARTFVHGWRRGVRLNPHRVLMPDPFGELEPVEVFFQKRLFEHLVVERQLPYVEETIRYFFEARKRPIHVVVHVPQEETEKRTDESGMPSRTSVIRTADGYYVLILTDNWWVSIQPRLQQHLETMMKHAIDPLGLRKIDPDTKAQKIAEMLFEFFWSRWEEKQAVQRRQSLWRVFDSLDIQIVSDTRPLDALLWDLLPQERRLTLMVGRGLLMRDGEIQGASNSGARAQDDWPHSFVLAGVPFKRMISVWDMMRLGRKPIGIQQSITQRWDYRAGGVLERAMLRAASFLGYLPAFDQEPGRLYRMVKNNGGVAFHRTRLLIGTLPLDPAVFLAVFFSFGVTGVWLVRFR